MGVLYDSYEAGADDSHPFSDLTYICQSFTASAAYTMTYIELKLYRIDTPGTITVNLYLADDSTNKPTGSSLATGTTDGDTLTTNTNGEWRTITFASSYDITNGEEYVIVCQAAGHITSVNWIEDGSSPSYVDGQGGTSNDAGYSWTMDISRDHYFRTYGGTAGGNVPVDKQYSKKLVVVGNNEVWYESVAGTMSKLAAAVVDITVPLTITEAFQKVFIANKTTLKVVDFANTKLTIANITTAPTRGEVVTQSGSDATMIVDFVNTAMTEIYGYTTSGTFDTTGGHTLSGGSMAPDDEVPTSVDEASTTPHWYDWTAYAGGTFGTITPSAYLTCRYRGRLVLSGNPNYPHQWYMSKVADPWNWVYSSTTALSAVAGNNTDAGEIGDIVRALIPFGDDFLVFGCANSVHVLDGDPVSGGSIDEVSDDTGIFSWNSWCKDEDGNLYFYGNQGIYIMTGGRGRPVNISKASLPKLSSDWAVNPSTHRIVLTYDSPRRGILITKTTISSGACVGYFYSLETQGFYPISIPDVCGIYSSFNYGADSPIYRKTIFGCNDGYLRDFLDTAEDDDIGDTTTSISSYFGIVEPLSEDPDRNGKLTSLTIEMAGGKVTTKLTHAALTTAHAEGDTLTQLTSGATMVVAYSNAAKTLTFGHTTTGTFVTTAGYIVSGDGSGSDFTPTAIGTGTFADVDGCSYEYHKGEDAETCLERMKDGAAPFESGTLTGPGRKNRIRTRLRAAWMAIKFYNSSASETFGVNRIFGEIKPSGKIKGK